MRSLRREIDHEVSCCQHPFPKKQWVMKSPGGGQLLRSALDHLGCLGQWMFKSLAWVCCSASCVAFVISNVPKHLKRRFAFPRHSSKDFMLYAETGVRLTQTLCFVTWLANGLQGCVESAGDGGVRASRGRWRQQYPRAHLKIERARRQTACPGSLHGGFGLCCNGPACAWPVLGRGGRALRRFLPAWLGVYCHDSGQKHARSPGVRPSAEHFQPQ